MNFSFENFQWVEFNQERITTGLENRIDLFEFSSLYPKREHEFYCRLLLKKLLYLNRILVSRFLKYHCEISNDPFEWLVSLENLLELNIDELLRLGLSIRLNLIFNYVNKLKQSYSTIIQKRETSKKKNNLEIEKIKAHSKKLSSFKEKKAYLLRKKTDFLQQNKNLNKVRPSLDEQIDLELNFLKAELKLLRGGGKEDEALVWTGQVQQLVEVFFHWLHQTNEAGLPLLKGSNERVIRLIIKNFKKIDGSSLSAASIRSLLRPSRQRSNSKSKQKKKDDDK